MVVTERSWWWWSLQLCVNRWLVPDTGCVSLCVSLCQSHCPSFSASDNKPVQGKHKHLNGSKWKFVWVCVSRATTAYLFYTTSLCPNTTRSFKSPTEPQLSLCCLVTKPSACVFLYIYIYIYTVCFNVNVPSMCWLCTNEASFTGGFRKGAAWDGG